MNAAKLDRSPRLSGILVPGSRGRLVDMKLKRYADPYQKFNSRIVSIDGCWQWDGVHKVTGYGQFRHRGKVYAAHRFAYEMSKGVWSYRGVV